MQEKAEILTFEADAADAGKRLDAFLAEKIEGRSRSRLQRIVADGDCLVNDTVSKPSYKIRAGDAVEIELAEISGDDFEPEDIPLEIVYEDEQLAVIDKPAGMVVHPGAGVGGGTLANAIAYHFGFRISDSGFEETGNPESQSTIRNPKSEIRNRVGIVHRLDKDTSGLIVVAKTEEAHEKLSEQFRNREVFKSYVALVHGETEEDRGEIDAPIAREKHNRTKMAVRAHGRHALSLWRVKKRFEKFTLLAVEIKTGRTHQIRVHLASVNHPIVGDETYNAGRDKTVHNLTIRQAIRDLNRFFLHAEKLSFTHPATGERLNFTAPLPGELTDFLELLY
ncbi:MAG: RluA family pseudouridine synthase [Acidobacteria bacterium]|nr:RluA family pseudouridine synthase [Acidobacteriota bacterium]